MGGSPQQQNSPAVGVDRAALGVVGCRDRDTTTEAEEPHMTDKWVVAITGDGGGLNIDRATDWLDVWLPADDNLIIYVPDHSHKLGKLFSLEKIIKWFDAVEQDYIRIPFGNIADSLVKAKFTGAQVYLILIGSPKDQDILDLYDQVSMAGIEVKDLEKAGLPFPDMPPGVPEMDADGLPGAPGYPSRVPKDDHVRIDLRDAPVTEEEMAKAMECISRVFIYYKENHMPGAFTSESPMRTQSVEPLAEIQEKKKYWVNSAGKIRIAGKSQPKGKEKEVYLTEDEAASVTPEELADMLGE